MSQPSIALNLFAAGASSDITWEPFRDGVAIHRIYGDGVAGPAAAFLRYCPGASVPRHEHQGYEHIFVISGSQEDESGVYGAGTLVVNPPGSRHAVVSKEGCLVLVVWERPITVLGG